MGQRSQLIVSVPQVYYNDKNPNNKPRRLFVLHSQWCYGVMLVNATSDFAWAIQDILNEEKNRSEVDWNHSKYGVLTRALRWAMNRHLHASTTFEEPFEADTDYTEDFDAYIKAEGDSEETFIDYLSQKTDNNNGWGIIHVSDDLKVSTAFINGTEDDASIKVRTPMDMIVLCDSKMNTINVVPELLRESIIRIRDNDKGKKTIKELLFDHSVKGKVVKEL